MSIAIATQPAPSAAVALLLNKRLGPGLDAATQMGPPVSREQQKRVVAASIWTNDVKTAHRLVPRIPPERYG